MPDLPPRPANPERTGRRAATIIPKEEVKTLRKIGEGAYGSVHEGTWADVHGAVSDGRKLILRETEGGEGRGVEGGKWQFQYEGGFSGVY